MAVAKVGPVAAPAPAHRQTDRRLRQRAVARRILPYVFIAPAVLYLTVLQVVPLVREFLLSLTNAQLLAPDAGQSVGVQNYSSVVRDPEFLKTLRATLTYTVGSVIGALVFGLIAALIMNRSFRGRALVRTAILAPWAAPQVATALVFTWMFNNQAGVVDYLLTKIGITAHYVEWLNNPHLAMYAVTAVTIWKAFPLTALVLLAALQAVPTELYEAARTNGASPFNIFRNVTLPGIRPTISVITLFMVIWSFRRFDIIWVLTQGGPNDTTNTLVVSLYRTAFTGQQLGQAAAIGILGLVLSTIATTIYFACTRMAGGRSERTG